MSNCKIILNEKEDQLSEDSSELKILREEIIKLKSENDKLVKKIGQLKMKLVEVIIHAYSHNAT